MIYRMKRNGAGLASICILCTMVLVMVSSTVCLYIGAEDSLRSRYPRNISLDSTASSMEGFVPEQVQAVKELTAKTVEDHGQTAENPLDYHVAAFAGYFHNGTFQTEPSSGTLITSAYQDMWQVFVVSLDDYNRLMGQEEQLEEGEALAYSTKSDFRENSVSIMGKNRITVKKFVPDFADNGIDSMQIVPSLYLFVPDVEQVVAPLEGEMDNYENPILTYHWFYGFDLNCADDAQILISNEIQEGLHQPIFSQGDFSISCESVAQERAGFYGLYGGLFFLVYPDLQIGSQDIHFCISHAQQNACAVQPDKYDAVDFSDRLLLFSFCSLLYLCLSDYLPFVLYNCQRNPKGTRCQIKIHDRKCAHPREPLRMGTLFNPCLFFLVKNVTMLVVR